MDVLIVGAGMAGLMAAHVLEAEGLSVQVIDKGRSVGGRLATRRIGPGLADHGAQFFTVRTPEFERWVDQWKQKGLVYRWSTGWSNGSLDKTQPNGYPRYATEGGMNALAKYLAKELEVQVNVRLTALSIEAEGWQAIDSQGRRFTSRSVILTPPVPQSLELLINGDTRLAQSDYQALVRISYAPCLAGMFWIDGPVALPEPGALQRPEHQFSWVADNQRKGISPEAKLITVHTGSAYSTQLWDLSDDEALETILAEGLNPFLAPQSQVVEAQLKRWRYALPTSLHSERWLAARGVPPLIFAGDAFGEARVEGAALSGMAAARKLLDMIL